MDYAECKYRLSILLALAVEVLSKANGWKINLSLHSSRIVLCCRSAQYKIEAHLLYMANHCWGPIGALKAALQIDTYHLARWFTSIMISEMEASRTKHRFYAEADIIYIRHGLFPSIRWRTCPERFEQKVKSPEGKVLSRFIPDYYTKNWMQQQFMTTSAAFLISM